jgi:outer membrane lipoprotein-sorting protein
MVLALGFMLAPAAHAADVNDILARMRKAVEPGRDLRATVVFTIANERGETVKWTGQMYRRAGALRLVFDEPADLRGTEVSVSRADATTKTRLYMPALRRTRLIDADTRGESFLGTDFNYEDLGFQQIDTQQLRLDESKDCYHVETVPSSGWWYGRIDRCIDKKSYLPLRTEYYDRSGVLWKVRTLGNVKKVDGHPTATEVKMENVPQRTSTTITLSDVQYDTGFPDSLLTGP